MSANAIGILRAFGGDYVHDCGDPDCADCRPYRDRDGALAAVGALLEAAKELLHDGRESIDNPLNFIASAADADDLAVAVRRVETGQ